MSTYAQTSHAHTFSTVQTQPWGSEVLNLLQASRLVDRRTCTYAYIANDWPEKNGGTHDLCKAEAEAILISR